MKSKVAGKSIAASEPRLAYYPAASDAPTDLLAHHRASGVSASVVSALAAVSDRNKQPDFEADGIGGTGASVVSRHGVLIASSPSGASAVIYPADAQGRRKVVATSVSGARTTTYINSNHIPAVAAAYAGRARAEAVTARAAAMAAIGVTPQYVAQMRAVGHGLANLDQSEFAEMRAVGSRQTVRPRALFRWLPGDRRGGSRSGAGRRTTGCTSGRCDRLVFAAISMTSSSSAPSESIPASRPAPETREVPHRRRSRRAPGRGPRQAAGAARPTESTAAGLEPARPRSGRLTARPPTNH